jgi:hypothetical protein
MSERIRPFRIILISGYFFKLQRVIYNFGLRMKSAGVRSPAVREGHG